MCEKLKMSSVSSVSMTNPPTNGNDDEECIAVVTVYDDDTFKPFTVSKVCKNTSEAMELINEYSEDAEYYRARIIRRDKPVKNMTSKALQPKMHLIKNS